MKFHNEAIRSLFFTFNPSAIPHIPRSSHYHEIDSMRGLAALSVAFGHFISTFKVVTGPFAIIGFLEKDLKTTPLYVFYAAHSAVMLFFLLLNPA
jgi:peptidoglycan/LPS O-acetylase OafA/YrhL